MAKQKTVDFETLIGTTTQSALDFANGWRNVNIANARDTQAQQLAEYFINFHTNLIGAPNFSGIIEPSAWLANERALQLARDSTQRSKVVCSNLTHISIKEACDKLGLDTIVVDADPFNNYQVEEKELLQAISGKEGDIAAIVSTHGTTQLGNVENIEKFRIVKELREKGTWLHIDAAFGGVLTQVSYLRKSPIMESDSVTIDPYKFLGASGSALLLAPQQKLNSKDIPYYSHSKFTRYSTLDASPIAVWYKSVQDIGLKNGMSELADECVQQASRFTERLTEHNIPLIRNPATIIVPIKTESRQETEQLRDYLHDKGYNVGRVVIEGNDYQTNGVRVACTPRQWIFRGIGGLQGLQREIIKYHDSKKLRAA